MVSTLLATTGDEGSRLGEVGAGTAFGSVTWRLVPMGAQ